MLEVSEFQPRIKKKFYIALIIIILIRLPCEGMRCPFTGGCSRGGAVSQRAIRGEEEVMERGGGEGHKSGVRWGV